MLQSEINRRMPDIVTLAIFGIWQSLQAFGRAKGDEEEEHHLIASQVPNIYVEDRGWQLRKVPKLMKKLWKVMSLHHQRRWKGGKINVKSYGLKRIKCLFFCAFSSCILPFFSPSKIKGTYLFEGATKIPRFTEDIKENSKVGIPQGTWVWCGDRKYLLAWQQRHLLDRSAGP